MYIPLSILHTYRPMKSSAWDELNYSSCRCIIILNVYHLCNTLLYCGKKHGCLVIERLSNSNSDVNYWNSRVNEHNFNVYQLCKIPTVKGYWWLDKNFNTKYLTHLLTDGSFSIVWVLKHLLDYDVPSVSDIFLYIPT